MCLGEFVYLNSSAIYGGGDRFSGGKGPRQRHIKLIAAGDTSPL